MRWFTTKRGRRVGTAGLVLLLTAAVAVQAQQIATTVAAPDGVRLATDVYLPLGLGPWPVVLQRTPYNKNELGLVCYVFNVLGFACVAQDTRGRYASEGVDTVFRDDGPDGHATLDWIAAQSWCNGATATFGGSALGLTQYALAPGAPPSLVAMMPAVATPDFYHHAAYQGGALRHALVYNWLADQGALYFYDLVKEHRLWDPWWELAAVTPRVAEIDVPALHMGGWYDIFLQGTLDAFFLTQHGGGPGARGRQYVLIGPWTHQSFGGHVTGELAYPENAAVNVVDIVSDWMRYWLSGASTGVEGWAPVRIYLMGAAGEAGAPGNRWLDLPDWPPPARPLPLYLTGSGELTADSGPPGRRELIVDPADPVPTLGGANLHPNLAVAGRAMGAGPYDQRPIEGREDVMSFTSAALASPLTVMGRVSCRLWVLPDTIDLDLAVRLTDVYPDGRSMLVADGIQRARMRCGDDKECFLTPGVAAEIVVDLWSTALVFNAGHRIRIDVAGSNAPRFEVNPNTGGDLNVASVGVVARPEILTGPQYPSRLELPVMATPRQRLRRGQ